MTYPIKWKYCAWWNGWVLGATFDIIRLLWSEDHLDLTDDDDTSYVTMNFCPSDFSKYSEFEEAWDKVFWHKDILIYSQETIPRDLSYWSKHSCQIIVREPVVKSIITHFIKTGLLEGPLRTKPLLGKDLLKIPSNLIKFANFLETDESLEENYINSMCEHCGEVLTPCSTVLEVTLESHTEPCTVPAPDWCGDVYCCSCESWSSMRNCLDAMKRFLNNLREGK